MSERDDQTKATRWKPVIKLGLVAETVIAYVFYRAGRHDTKKGRWRDACNGGPRPWCNAPTKLTGDPAPKDWACTRHPGVHNSWSKFDYIFKPF